MEKENERELDKKKNGKYSCFQEIHTELSLVCDGCIMATNGSVKFAFCILVLIFL
jgi:hypothetical protein